jgi:hypothetical protein
MRNNKLAWAIVTSIAAGLAVYMIVKKRRSLTETNPGQPGTKHLTDVFSRAKNYGGGEFVL